MYTLFAGIALLMSSTAIAQTPPVAGGGCTPATHTFCVFTTVDSGTGSLRQAILDSNIAGGANKIGFNIPTNPVAPTPQTITLASSLPAINPNNPGGAVTSLMIDGYSQPGSVLNTNAPDQGGLNTKLMIEIVGSGQEIADGFHYACCAAPLITLTLQGLALNGFFAPVGDLGGATGGMPHAQWNIYGCFSGTNIDGTAMPAHPNGNGIVPGNDNVQIGGAQSWQRNLISGNGYGGVEGVGPNATVIIEGNLIGTDVTGTLPISNFSIGLDLSNAPGLRVGCTSVGPNPTCRTTASRNIISGNRGNGMILRNGPAPGLVGGAQIKGNYIGTDWTGTKALSNGDITCCPNGAGVEILGALGPAVIIGGFASGEGNLIAYNGGPGIWGNDENQPSNIGASFDNQGNAIHSNRNTDISFSYFINRMPNDPGDADTGSNNQQNYPVIQSASVSGNQLTVKYLVDTDVANATYPVRIDFYIDIDEGSGAFLVSDSYPAASAGMPRTVTLTLPSNALPLVGFVAGATTADGYSSEFSPSYVFDRISADRFEGQ